MKTTTQTTDRTRPAPRYKLLWRNRWLTAGARSLQDMIGALQGAVEELRALHTSGVSLDRESAIADDHALLVTTDAEVARTFGFEAEEEAEEEGRGRRLTPAPPSGQD